MRNNNAAVIRKLTFRCLRADRRRNLFLVLAIVLTALLIAAVFSIAMSYVDVLLVSDALSDRFGKTVAEDGSATVIFSDLHNINAEMDRLAQDIGLADGQDIRPLPMYNISTEATFSTALSIALIVLFLMLMGYLLIYNVLYISISRNVRFFGLLKTIGTTPRQIRAIVLGQTALLCVVGIPLGLLAAAGLSSLLLPALLTRFADFSTGSVVSFSPVIYGGAALFALATALIGSLQPARKAARISPVEAAKYVGVVSRKRKTHGRAHAKPGRMALRNVFRDRKRAAIVLLGLFLGMTVFMAVTTLVSSMNTDGYVAMYMDSDFTLENTTTAAFSTEAARQVFDADFMAAIDALPGLSSVEADSYAWAQIGYTEAFQQDARAFIQSAPGDEVMTDEEIAANYSSVLKGVDRAAIEKLNETLDTPVDVDAFERGDIVLIATNNPEYFGGVDVIDLYSDGAHMQVKLGGFAPMLFRNNGRSLAPTLIVSHALMEELTGDVLYTTLHIDVLPGYEQQTLDTLTALMDGNHDMTRSSRIEAAEELRDAKWTLYILGGGVAAVLGLIGLLNFVNIMSVGVVVRKRELATLQSVGMTQRQVRRMLMDEGLWYAGLSIGLILTLGVGITYGLFTLFARQATYAVFTFPYAAVALVLVGVLLVCVITPLKAYHRCVGASLVERLREVE